MKKIFTLITAFILFGSLTVKADTYTPAGTPASVFTNEWTPNTPANDMVLSNGLYVFAKKDNFASKTSISFKVCKDHAWTTAYPGSNYGFDIPAGSKYLIITYNTSGNAVNAFAISSMTVAGDNGTLFGDTWTPSATANDMTLQNDGTYKFEKSGVALSAGSVNFKACANHAWTNAWPSDNYSLSIPEAGKYTITITFNPATLSVSATADLEEAVVVIPTIQLHSNIQNPSWESTANFAIAGNEETASLTLTDVSKGSYEFGVKIDGTWTSNGSAFTRANNSHAIAAGSSNCTFNADRNGDYTFTWTYATNTLSVTYPAIPSQSVAFNSLASQILKGSVINLANCVTSSGIDNPTYRFYIKEKNGSYGDAINANYSFNANGEYVVKVEALEDGDGEPVAYDESAVVVYQSYTFTNESTIYVDFSAMTEGAKGVNYPKVNEVGLDWDGSGAGTIKTITFTSNVTWTTMAEAFVKTEKNSWDNLPFTVPGIGKNCVVVAADGASYTWGTYVPAPPTIKLHGNFTGSWANTDAFAVASGNATASLTLNIPAKGTKNFGVRIGSDDNWTSNGASITRASASAVITSGEGNCSLNADIAGNYTFTWTYATNTLAVTYPALPDQMVEFDGLSAEILKGTVINFAATSSGITNPVYSFYVKPAGGEYGSAVTSYTFNAEGSFTVKVSAEGDNTVAPIVEEQNVAIYDAHTFTSGQKLYIDFTAMTEGDKGVNYPSADAASAGAYDAEGAGKFITVTFTTDVTWSTLSDFIKTENGGWDPGMKFTVPSTGQNWVKVSADGDSYTWDTYVDLTTNIYLVGSIVGWDPLETYHFMKATEDATVASTTVTINEYSNITFKLKDNGAWRGCDPVKTITKDDNTVTILSDAEGNNVAMTPYAAGDYIFTLNLSTRELTVTYPSGDPMPIPQNIFLAGEMNNWAPADNNYKFAISGDVATLEVTTLEAMHDYEFKLVYNGTWLRADYNFNYYWCSDVAFSAGDGDGAKIYTFKAGTYTFTYNLTSGQLSIAYPATSATNIEVSQYEYATLYSATAYDVPAEVEAYIISGIEGNSLTMERIYRIPANTGVLLHAPQGTYQFYEGDGRWMEAPASNLLKGSTVDQEIDNELVHFVLSYDTENQVGFYWPYGTGAAQGVGSFENKAGKAYVEIPAESQSAGVIARRGFPFRPIPEVATGIEQGPSDQVPSTKMLLDGQLFIIRDGMLFNAQGVRVQ